MELDQHSEAAWLKAQAGLSKERQHINQVDAQIAALLAERFETVDHIVALKKSAAVPVLNAKRETQVLDAAAEAVGSAKLAPHARAIFTTILAESRDYQEGQLRDQPQKA